MSRDGGIRSFSSGKEDLEEGSMTCYDLTRSSNSNATFLLYINIVRIAKVILNKLGSNQK